MVQIPDNNDNAFQNLKKYLEEHPIPIILKPDDSLRKYAEQRLKFTDK